MDTTEIFALAAQRARDLNLPYAGALTPEEAFAIWRNVGGVKLVDVRTQAEWTWVGRVPDAIEIEWMHWPSQERNGVFLEELASQVDKDATVLFLCRSGVRSNNAAILATSNGWINCYNILGGFEGDKDEHQHRNTLGGWRKAGMPWVQG